MTALRWLAALLALAALPIVVFGALLLHGGSRDEPHVFDAERAAGVTVGAPREIVPGPGLPDDLDLGPANNNLDVADYDGRTFLAFRTARFHWASDDARILVLSSDDRRRWVHEATFDLERRDLREPRLLVLQGRLLLYFFEARDAATGFAPLSIRVALRAGDGRWSPSRPILDPGHVVWRTKLRRGRAWMSVYDGRGLYDELGRAGATRLLHSTDGVHWTSTSGEGSPIDVGGTSECAFEFDAAGNLVALVRVEARGALLCTAPAARLERWDCTPTPYRHDSPILFRHGDDFWAIARRNLGGPVELAPAWVPGGIGALWTQLRYWVARKRTTLYRVDPGARRVVPVRDLPGSGDTAFAGVVEDAPGRYWVANYASPLGGPDLPWVLGQRGETRIHAYTLTLP